MADLRDLLTGALKAADRDLEGSPRTEYRFGDIPVSVRLDGRGRIPALLGMIRARQMAATGDAWSIDVVGGSDPGYVALLPPEALRRTSVLRSNADMYYLWLDEAGGYLSAIDRRSRRGIVWFTAPERVASWHVARPLMHALKGISLTTPWTPVHAAAVAQAGRAVLVVGQSGAGKTSIALASALAGWDYLGDDAVIVRPDPPTVGALYSSCRLRADMFAMFPNAMIASQGISDDAGETKAEIDMNLLDQSMPESVAIDAIVLPHRSGAPSPEFVPTTWSDTVRKMMTASREILMGDEAASFDKLTALARRLPCYRFDPGPDAFATPAALSEMLQTKITT